MVSNHQIKQMPKLPLDFVGALPPRNAYSKFNPIMTEVHNVSYPRIFCWICTHPPNHGTKAAAVRDTWGKRCDKILFISNADGKKFSDLRYCFTLGVCRKNLKRI